MSSYPLKYASIHPTVPSISLAMSEIVPPDLSDIPDLNPTLPIPRFYNGQRIIENETMEIYGSGQPLFIESCPNGDWSAVDGISVRELGVNDYAKFTAGTIDHATHAGEYFVLHGYHNATFFGLYWDFGGSDDELILTTLGQTFGAPEGGVADPVALNTPGTDTRTFAVSDAQNEVIWKAAVQAAGSTDESPLVLFVYGEHVSNDPTVVGAFKVDATGAIVSDIGLFATTDALFYNAESVLAHITEGSAHYFLFGIHKPVGVPEFGDPAEYEVCLVTTTEQAYPATEYDIEQVGFDDEFFEIGANGTQVKLRDIGLGFLRVDGTFAGDALPAFYSPQISATDRGFIVVLYKHSGALATDNEYEIHFLLVDKTWSTFQFLEITGDTTTDAILAEANSSTWGVLNGMKRITMAFANDVYSLIGGSHEAPMIVQTLDGDPGGGEPVENDDSVNLRVWGFSLDDHDFYVLRVGASLTLVYDLKTGQWAEWRSPARTNWRAHVGQNWLGMGAATIGLGFGTDIVAGDDVTGALYILDPTTGRDDRTTTDSDPFTRTVIGGIPLIGRDTAPCNAVQLSASLGVPTQTGATITLRTSDDLGHNWVDHGAIELTAASYDQVVEWRALGLMRQPGRIFEFSDDGACIRLNGADMR